MHQQNLVVFSHKGSFNQLNEMQSVNSVENIIHSLKKSSSKQDFFKILLTQQVANNIR